MKPSLIDAVENEEARGKPTEMTEALRIYNARCYSPRNKPGEMECVRIINKCSLLYNNCLALPLEKAMQGTME